MVLAQGWARAGALAACAAPPCPSLPTLPAPHPCRPFPLPPVPPQVLRGITEVFGQDMWFSTVLLLTHGGAAPPDTAAGQPMAPEMFYQQRGQQAQNLLRQVAGDQR